MSRTRRLLLASSLFLLNACGLLGGDAPGEAPGDAPAAVQAPANGTPVQPAATPQDTAPATPSAEPATAEAQTLDQRLEQIVASQETLGRRLDSLTAALASTQLASPTSDAAAVQDAAPGLGGSDVLNEAGERVRSFGVGVVWSIIVVALFTFLIRGTVWLLDALAERNPSQRLFYKRLVPVIRIVLWIFAAYLIVSVIFRVDAQGLFAAAAAVGVAVGFAAQDLLKNLFGGIILVFDQPFQVGDKISVGGTYGEVKSIGLRSTRIVTPDDNLVSVPNAQVVDQQVANANAGELNCQVVTDLYLPGWPDEALAKRIAFDAAASSKYVYLNKPIVVLVADQFQQRFMTRVRVKAYVLDPRLEFLFQSEVTERARAGFREAGLLDPEVSGPYTRDAVSAHDGASAGAGRDV